MTTNLKSEAARLRAEEARVREERERIEAELAAARLAEVLERDYVKVVCVDCEGTGVYGRMSGSDNMDWDEFDCEKCYGEGFVHARKFIGKPPRRRRYDMTYDRQGGM